MSRHLLLRLGAAALLISADSLWAQDSPTLDGYITRAGTADNFDVNGTPVSCHIASQPIPVCRPRVYGEHLLIYGKRDKRSNTIAAQRIELASELGNGHVSGVALLDGVLSTALIRADGYALQLTAATKETWNPPLTATSKPAAGQWIQYQGEREGGTVVLKQISFYQPVVTPEEQHLREKTSFDASAVTEDDRQSGASKLLRGTDYKRIPAVHDPVLQTRVESIGERLIPKWQKLLPDNDANKTKFQFQLVDANWPDCVAMPSGIILVPVHSVGQLADDELATVLADNIAAILEKQTHRSTAEGRALLASELAGGAAGAFIPGLSVVPIAGGFAAQTITKHLEEQSGRESLVLLHDGGFDIQKAPLAWWRLSAHRTDFMTKPVPDRAAYLFTILACDWTNDSPLLSSAT